MSRVMLAIGIIVFWLSFPVLALFMETPDFQEIDLTTLESIDGSNFIINILNVGKIYVQAMTFTLFEIPIYMQFIIWILQVISALAVFFMLRG